MRKRHKYGARKVELDGHKFDSAKEANRYAELHLLEKAGIIEALELQPRFPIIIGGVPIKQRSHRYGNGRQVVYVADFRYVDVATGETVIEDVKGQATRVYLLKRALVEAMGLTVREI